MTLTFIDFPVSAILWFWHRVFGAVLDPASGYAWALSVVFLVFTLRALLFKPFVHQMRSMKKMQEIAPQIKALQESHRDDRQRLAQEMQKLQSEQGFNPLGGCLPMLVQIPVFLGLFQVLRGFRPGAVSNFVFNASDVASFVNSSVFGAKLANTISQPAPVLASFGTDRAAMLIVGVPLMILAGVATHFTARHSITHQNSSRAIQKSAVASSAQTATMNRLTMWVFPFSLVIAGPFLPLAILVYWLANNVWTLAQQRFVYRRLDREQAERAGALPLATASDAGLTTSGAGVGAADSATDQPGEIPGVIEDRSHDVNRAGGLS